MRRMLIALSLTGTLLMGACQSAPARREVPAPSRQLASEKPLHYVDLAKFDVQAALPSAPPDRAILTRGEAELMLAMQAEAGDAAKARARSEDKITAWDYTDVLGPAFRKDRLPRLSALLQKVDQDTSQLTMMVKDKFARTRPPLQDDRIRPLLKVPASGSYPSGHAIHAMVWARVLALVEPEKEQELLQRARLVSYGRVIAGVHFPTDVSAGMGFANVLIEEFQHSPAFQSDLLEAREEWGRMKQ